MTGAELDRRSSEDGAAELTRAMREEAIVPESAGAPEARRARLVPSIENMILRSAEERRLRHRRLLSWGALAAAAVLAVSIAVPRLLRDAPAERAATGSADAIRTPDTNGPSATIPKVAIGPADSASSAPLASGSRVRTTTSQSALVLPDGARVAVAPETSLELVEGSRTRSELLLERGRVELDVPHLDKGAELVVRTEVGSVVVHGTRFSVETGRRPEGAWMSVEVSEGEVAVLQEGVERARLRSGDAWRSSPPGRSLRPIGSASTASSDLAAQNEAYASAMRSKARGDDLATVKELGAFVHRWPDSPLAPEARAELARARKRIDKNQ